MNIITRIASFIAVTALAMGLAACVTPQKEDPVVTLLDTSTLGLVNEPLLPLEAQWWKAFGDPQLDQLVDDASRNSPSLSQALARVRVAQAQRQAVDAADEPGFSIDADETWQRFSENYIIPPPYGGHTYWLGQATANLSWTLDFWGRQAGLISQARSAEVASSLDVGSARLALAGSIAQAYIDLNRAWALIDVVTRQLDQREQLLRLARQRVAAGLDTQIDVKIAEAALPQARAAKLQAESARDLAVHRLAALAGYGVERYAQFVRPQLNLDAALPVPTQLPLDLLSHRPDILAARARVTAATAGRESAHAAFYPDISLKAFVGSQAIGLDNLVKGSSLIYGAGPALHLPIFDSQRLRASYKGATAELDASIANYNDAVLNAVREAADQLSLGESYTQQLALIQQSLTAATAAYDLAQKRYAAGLTTQLVVLNAESRVLDARRELVTATTGRISARITLLLVLGGSFDPAAPVTVAHLESSR
jgi:NodT family efflux transporter outer membrane factor (OMF) lipoprotein